MFGFWFEMPTATLTAEHTALPITRADANGVYFEASRKLGVLDQSISGGVDRITGAVSATEWEMHPNGSEQILDWDLHCKPTRPLF